MKFLTCGVLGKPHTQSWKYIWILQVMLYLGANALCALMVTQSPGYITYKMPAVCDLMLFYTTRPRIAWLVLGALKDVGSSRFDPTAGYWESAGRSSLLAEIVLECIGANYMGRTVHWAHLKRYYILHRLDGYVHRTNILQMIIGALLYLLHLVPKIFILWSSSKAEITGNRKAGFSAFLRFLMKTLGLAWMTSVSFASSWVFMAGYVKLAGPK